MSFISLLAAAAAGIASHLLFFKHSERHLYPLRYVQFIILAFVAGSVLRTHYFGDSIRYALEKSFQHTAVYLAGLYASLIIYRLFFNPLNRFPGPLGARFSKFDHTFRLSKMDGHHMLQRSHNKYGRYLRIGPNDVSITDPAAIQVVLGQNSKCSKAQWYSQDVPLISMHTTRDRAQHDRRRRILSPAFSDKALRGYENRIQKYNDLLINQISESLGQPMNVSKWFNFYSFDVMGDLGFGQPFDMLKSGKSHWAINLLNEGMDPVGFCFPPWFFRTLLAIPGAATGYFRFINFCTKQLDDRMKVEAKPENPDITYTLIDHFNKADSATQKATLPLIQGDSRLIIVAGSDTTAATLVHLFYHLASKPHIVEKLREELSPLVPPDGSEFEHKKIQDAAFLNGCINETLRLNPPVPSGVFRKTPREGIQIGETYVPGNTVIQIPGYVMGHDETCYVQCEDFIPERWSSRPELIKEPDAFAPFSVGPYNCIGKNLALLEVRKLTAQLIMQFNVALADGEDGSTLLTKTRDHFTLGLADLNLVFTRREKN